MSAFGIAACRNRDVQPIEPSNVLRHPWLWKVTVGYRKTDKVIMPAYKVSIPADEDRWRVVQFVRTLGPAR